MANGQQIAEENLRAFLAWMTSKSDGDFKEYVFRGKLKRLEIATECGFGKSALNQNPAIKDALEQLEGGLRERGVLPLLKEANDNGEPPMRDREASQRSRDRQRLNALEQQNAVLQAKLDAAKSMLQKYEHLEEFLTETGRLPR